MKTLICPRCRQTAVGPKTESWPHGEPLVISRFTGGRHPLIVKCMRCTGAFKVDALSFNSSPETTPELVRKLGLDS